MSATSHLIADAATPAWRDLGVGFRDRKSLSGAAAAFLGCTRQWLAENGYKK